jgi:phenol 2-monooxygenase
MNISMQDSHNLAWKLAHIIFGLTPNSSALLHTYEFERRPAASRVVFFDKRWNQSDMTVEQRVLEGKDQVLGCGVEYDFSIIVGSKAEDHEKKGDIYPVTGTNYIDGILRAGRRLLNVRVRRFADGTPWDIHDDLPANGRYRIIVICGDDFPDPQGRSLPAVTSVCGTIVPKFPKGMVEAIILQPDMKPEWHFDDLPECIKDEAEMRLHCASQDAYDAYGLDQKRGALLLIRPEGMAGMIARLEETELLDRFLQQALITVA